MCRKETVNQDKEDGEGKVHGSWEELEQWMASSAFPGFESSETRGSGSPLSRGTDSLQPPMTEAGFSHAY